MMKAKRWLARCLVLILVIALIPAAGAESFAAYVKSAKMPVYTDSSLSNGAGTLKKYTVVNVLSYSGSVAKISYGGRTGYAMVSDMGRVDEVATLGTVNTETRVYRSPSADSESARVSAGTDVKVLAVNGDWCLVERNGVGGYMLTSTVTMRTGSELSATPTPAPVSPAATPDPGSSVTATVKSSSVTIYRKADTNSEALGRLKKGTTVTVLAYNSTWAYITLNGNYGYCSISALKRGSATAAPTITPQVTVGPGANLIPAVVQVTSVMVYSEASATAARLGRLRKGAEVNVVAYSGNWAYIERNGSYGYCSIYALKKVPATATPESTATPVPTATPMAAGTAVVSADRVMVYQSASTSSTKLGRLSKGREVNLIAVDGSWAYIELNGNYGYCSLSALSTDGSLDGYTVETFGATVVVSDGKLYAKASTDAQSKAIAIGTDVTVKARTNKWAYVDDGTIKGFIPLSALSKSQFATLTTESSGSSVSMLETALLTAGYFDRVPDTTYDSNTQAAVKRLQADLGMTGDGSASQSLQRVLYSGNGPVCSLLTAGLDKGSKGDDVTRLQTRLYSLKFLSKASSLDGDYGNATANAVKLFQEANGLTQNGAADLSTLRLMYSASAKALLSTQTAADITTVITPVDGGSQTNHSTKISAELASTTSTYSSSMSNAEKLEYVIYVAQQQLGKRYVYGTSGTSTYDCTGLTCYCFKQIGIKLKRSGYSQGYDDTYPKITSISDLQRGDLVFFNTISDSDLSDHAGIYLGAGWFIQASSGQGKVVVSTLASGYYNRVFSWGRRVFN